VCVAHTFSLNDFYTIQARKSPLTRVSSVSICRPEAGVVHSGRGHQSAAEPQTCTRRVPAEAPAQLLSHQRKLHSPEPAAKRQLPPLQCNQHRTLNGQRAGLLLQIGQPLSLLSCRSQRVY